MRNTLIKDLVDQIENTTWQRFYRRKTVGCEIIGWSQRLYHFGLNNSPHASLPQHLIWLKTLEKNVKTFDLNKGITPNNGLLLGGDILKWGGVEKGNSFKLPSVLKDVVVSSRKGSRTGNAPMNAGWTKIAAVFNYHDTSGHTSFEKNKPQIIWDSRVSLSICSRLGDAAKKNNIKPKDLQNLFPDLGWSDGQGGNRKAWRSKAENWFPNRYGKWGAHFAGGQVAFEISELLNALKNLPASALNEKQLNEFDESGRTALSQWTPWLVACVLFMDGY